MARKVKVASVERYVSGSNARMDAIMDGETVFIVQGSMGRVPLIADSEEAAVDRYYEKYKNKIELFEEDEVEESQE